MRKFYAKINEKFELFLIIITFFLLVIGACILGCIRIWNEKKYLATGIP